MAKHRHDFEKRYFEITAKMILEHVYGDSFGDLVVSDKPDIVAKDMSIGIEVTRVVTPEIQERNEYFRKNLLGKELADLDKKGLKRFEKDGYQVLTREQLHHTKGDNTVVAYCSPVFCITTEPIKDAIVKKIDIINTRGYQPVRRLCLYVFTEDRDDYLDDDIQEAAEDVAKQNSNAGYRFDVLFVDNWERLYRFDFATHETETVEIKELHDNICDEARKLADLGD